MGINNIMQAEVFFHPHRKKASLTDQINWAGLHFGWVLLYFKSMRILMRVIIARLTATPPWSPPLVAALCLYLCPQKVGSKSHLSYKRACRRVWIPTWHTLYTRLTFQKVIGYDYPLDFSGALIYLEYLGVAHQFLHRIIPGITVSPENLHCF